MVLDYSIAVSNVPLGGRAVANFDTRDTGQLVDVDSVTAEWRDQNGLLLETLTRTTVDVSGTDIYGNASTLTDPAGTGNYRSTLVIDSSNYAPPATGFRWSLTLIVVKGAETTTQVFYFYIVPTTITISLDTASISDAVMRQVGITEDIEIVCNDDNKNLSLARGIVYAIRASFKNGVPISYPTDYAWTTYRSNVTLVATPAVNDHFMFTVQKQSDAFVQDVVVRKTQEVLRALKPHYDDAALIQSPSVIEIIKAFCIGQFKQDLSQGVALDSAFYRSGFDLVRDMKTALTNICLGVEDIFDAIEQPLARKTGTVVGGRRHADGNWVNRLGLQDRVQQHTGLFVYLRPDPILAITRATRGYVA